MKWEKKNEKTDIKWKLHLDPLLLIFPKIKTRVIVSKWKGVGC